MRPTPDASSPPSSRPLTPCSSASSQGSYHSDCSDSSLSEVSSLSSVCALSRYATRDATTSEPRVDHLRLLRRAIKEEDGPKFLQVMDAINGILRLLKYPIPPLDPFDPTPPDQFHGAIRAWDRIPFDVVQRIVDETYQRAVGPNIEQLRHYEAFSSEVYGELLPPFVSDIVRATGLTESSLFLDLGSGVGNVVLQASLETGCTSFGIEVMPGPARLARSQLAQFENRCRMWGVRMGKVDLEEGDMLRSPRVDQLVKEADVVLVNNKVFLEPRAYSPDPPLSVCYGGCAEYPSHFLVNEALRQKFLDLKEGAVVVSLKCLMGSGRSTTRGRTLPARGRSSSPALKERNVRLHYSCPPSLSPIPAY